MSPAVRRSLIRLLAMVVLAVGLLMAVPGTASSHTGLRATEPAADSTVTTAPQAVTVTFSAGVLGGDVTVTGPDGTPVGSGPVAHDGAVLTAPVSLTAAGRHSVAWSAVADDGHALDGTFAFEFAPATPIPTTAAPTTTDPTTDGTPAATGSTADTAADTATDAASASAGDGLSGWVLAVAGLTAAGAALVVLRSRRRG